MKPKHLGQLLLQIGIATTILANTQPALTQASSVLSQFRPPDLREPERRDGGGTRGGGVFDTRKAGLTVLVPKDGGVTLSEYPTFLVYIPPSVQSNLQAEFVLEEAGGIDIYTTVIQPLPTEGIISITLPNNPSTEALKIGQSYRWLLSIRGSDESLEGTIQRVQPSNTLREALKKAKPQELPSLYQQEGIWYEAISSLAELRRQNPSDPVLMEQWKSLLKLVDLEDLADFPLLAITGSNNSGETPVTNSSETQFRPTDNRLSPQMVPGSEPRPTDNRLSPQTVPGGTR